MLEQVAKNNAGDEVAAEILKNIRKVSSEVQRCIDEAGSKLDIGFLQEINEAFETLSYRILTLPIRSSHSTSSQVFEIVANIDLLEYLNPTSAISLAATCSNLFAVLAPKISKKFKFRNAVEYHKYQPQVLTGVISFEHLSSGSRKITVNEAYLSCSGVPASVTHLTATPITRAQKTYLAHGDKFATAQPKYLFLDPITPSTFPPNLTHLKLGNWFNHPLDNLPSTLLFLYLGTEFTHPIDTLPPNLQHLCFAKESKFNSPIDRLPGNLQILDMGHHFNLPVESLPHSLTTLQFRRCFNQSVSKLPPFLTTLEVGNNFNFPIDNLPQTITYLHLESFFFEHPISVLPPELKHLILFTSPRATLLCALPTSLLTVNYTYYDPNAEYLDPHKLLSSLQGLSVHYYDKTINSFPSNITSIYFGVKFNQEISYLPPTLRSLLLGGDFNSPIQSLPSSLTKLYFVKVLGRRLHYSHTLPPLPPTLTKLRLAYWHTPTPFLLSPSLTSFTVPAQLLQVLPQLPSSLTSLSIGQAYSAHFSNLPDSIEKLKVRNFDEVIFNRPASLRRIRVSGEEFTWNTEVELQMYPLNGKCRLTAKTLKELK